MKDDLSSLISRVEALEKAVFAARDKSKTTKKSTNNYSGPKGGVLLLIEEGILSTPRSVDEVKQEMEKRDFYYQRSVIQTAMNRLATQKGPLTYFEKSGKKVYVVRK